STKLQQQAQEVQNLPPSVPPAQNRIFVRLLLAPKNELKLKELQKKLSSEQKAPVDLNEVIGILLDAYEKRENKVGEPAPAAGNSKTAKSAKIARPTQTAIKSAKLITKPTLNLQHAPAQIQSQNPKQMQKIPEQMAHNAAKQSSRHAWPECVKLPKIFHHTLRFSLNPSHDPNYLVPLCKNHEQLAHHGLIENEELSPENWRLKTETDKSVLKYQIDRRVISHYAPQLL
ncbi:hypothetical protein HZC21_02285, partial [Candidatus Peregrinibacteria bacterium]|nr:hypothetical protein [Candidatus Peregrinibacteria bacterium]